MGDPDLVPGGPGGNDAARVGGSMIAAGLRSPLPVIILLCVLLPSGRALEGGRIGVLYIGDPIPGVTPYTHMRSDPLLQATPVMASLNHWIGWGLKETDRAMRLYMPRTYDQLTDNYDVLILSDANRDIVGVRHNENLARGVEEAGLGMAMCGGWETFGGAGAPPWGETAVGQLLPTRDVVNTAVERGTAVFDQPGHELISSIPWTSRIVNNLHTMYRNMVTLKQGALQLAHWRDGERRHPFMATWTLGGGARTFSFTGDWERGSLWVSWKYYPDFISNLMIYLDRRPVPQDVDLTHLARASVFEANTRRSLLISLVDFAEKFGASTARILDQMKSVDSVLDEAKAHYLELDFDTALEVSGRAERLLAELEDEAVRLKDRALVWVYVIEWLTVSGTGAISASILWSVMVKRKLYRGVGATRQVLLK